MRTDEDATIILWCGGVPLTKLLADVDTLAQGLAEGAVLRVRTDLKEAWTAVPALCLERGYRLLHQSDTWEGVTEIALMAEYPPPSGPYRFDIAAH
jgi:hypothetical protein